MNNAFTMDFSQFDRALAEYAIVSKKDFSDAMNRQMNNLAIQGLKLQRKAESASITAVQNQTWWPRYIAKLLVMRKGAQILRRFAKGKRGSTPQKITHFYTRAQAQRFSASIIRKRLRAVTFLKAFFSTMSKAFAPLAGGGRGSNKTFSGFAIQMKPATVSSPSASIAVGYTYRRRGDKTARNAQQLLDATLARAIPATIRDMRQYMERKMAATAARHSAKRAA